MRSASGRRARRGALFVLAVIALLLVVGPFLLPMPEPDNPATPLELADPESRFAQIDGLEVHYQQTGSGEPTLLLLHGFLASTHTWREVVEPLSEQATVLTYDRPAFGITERPTRGSPAFAQRSPYGPDAQVAMTVGLLDAQEQVSAVLVGHSAGGSIAVAVAIEHPQRVDALVLISPAILSGGGAPSWLRPILSTPQGRRLGRWFVGRIPEWGERFGRSAWHDPAGLTQEALEGYREPLRIEGWDAALWELVLAGSDYGVAGRLEEIGVPTLVITGGDDRIVPVEQSREVAARIPDAELAVIPACGHVAHEECPSATLAAIRSFLGEHVTGY